jgi:predicted O-linked N-acetylglucosamine transferase (SPINDLY family)
MSDATFMLALQKITTETLNFGEVINVADTLVRSERPDLAEQIYRVWIRFNPDHELLYVAHFNLSALTAKSGNAKETEQALRAAIAHKADFMPAYVNLGGVLERKGTIDEAVILWSTGVEKLAVCTGSALDYKALLLKQISRVLIAHKQPGAAETTLARCLELNPNQRDALGQYVPLRLSQCKWPVVTPSERLSRAVLVSGLQPLSAAAYTDDPLLLLGAAWNYIKSDVNDPARPQAFDRRRAPTDISDRRMRIGYVSSDLRDHAIGYLMAELFELHDKSKVEVFAYYCGEPSQSDLTHRIQAAVEHWVDIRDMSEDAAAARIAADGIDILVDVNGLTKDARTAVFARRPAPVQVNWLGFPGSAGSPYHHYIIADDFIIPTENELYYSEKVVRLPCYQANDRKRIVAEQRPTRAEAGLPDDAFVFCCFNGAQKITRFTFDRWMTILQRTPGSVLWLLESDAETNDRLANYALERGLEPGRVIFAPKQFNPLHLARYPLADLFLDTSPYGAHTTASDALWMSVPVLTVAGRSFAARVCGSLVRAAGVPELVCDTPSEFVERAVELAHDRPQLQTYRQRLQDGRGQSTLFDMNRLVIELEALYRGMCVAHQEGRTPQPDLRNLDVYAAIGAEIDHEAAEMLAMEDYAGFYRGKLALRHWTRPIPADVRLWTPRDILNAEGEGSSTVEPASISEASATPADADEPHPLLHLQDVYNAASLILCEPLTKTSEAELERLLVAAKQLTIDLPEGSVLAGWEKHYRLLFEAIDPSLLRLPASGETPDVEGPLVTSTGGALDWRGVRDLAQRLSVEAVFFVAADEAYVNTYAKLYIESVLKHCDVRCLVVVHVIGGAAELERIAKSVAIDDDRLVFVGDGFDAQAVTTRCFDSPPKGASDKPIAHFQSVRFMRLGALLKALKRPIFVSDIDLLLQRGVKDLLLRCKDADIVLNENELNTNAGSRLTANLMLVNPTSNATMFLKFLPVYLREMLGRPEVTRWIDQLALLMGRHRLMRQGKKPNIQYFDTSLDINNLMYKSYQDNPYRFFSLYHGFDMASLDKTLQPSAESIAAE